MDKMTRSQKLPLVTRDLTMNNWLNLRVSHLEMEVDREEGVLARSEHLFKKVKEVNRKSMIASLPWILTNK
jgi:hypothetical protein